MLGYQIPMINLSGVYTRYVEMIPRNCMGSLFWPAAPPFGDIGEALSPTRKFERVGGREAKRVRGRIRHAWNLAYTRAIPKAAGGNLVGNRNKDNHLDNFKKATVT